VSQLPPCVIVEHVGQMTADQIAGDEQHDDGGQQGSHQELAAERGIDQSAEQQIERTVADDLAVLELQIVACRVAQCGVIGFGGGHLLAARLATQRHVADQLITVPEGRHMRFDPIEIAILATVLEQAHPWTAGRDVAPEIGEDGSRHVGVAQNAVRLADHLVFAVAADFDEVRVDEDDATVAVGPRDDQMVIPQHEFMAGDRPVAVHGCGYSRSLARTRRVAWQITKRLFKCQKY